jgi:phage host-nuclease inhibitor protein Gam
MGSIEIFYTIGATGLSIISYFLKKTMDEIKEIKEMTQETKQKVAILEVDYLNKVSVLHEKIENLQESLKELTTELKEFNKNIKK